MDNIEIRFKIVSTDNPDESILNTIILLLHDLNVRMKSEYRDELYIKSINNDIDRMQRELENLRYKEINNDK